VKTTLRRWVRFSLRGLLMAFVVIGLVLSQIARRYEPVTLIVRSNGDVVVLERPGMKTSMGQNVEEWTRNVCNYRSSSCRTVRVLVESKASYYDVVLAMSRCQECSFERFQIMCEEGTIRLHSPFTEPVNQPSECDATLPPMTLHVSANNDGRLKSISLNGRKLANLDELRELLRAHLSNGSALISIRDEALVEFDFDPHLKWNCAVQIWNRGFTDQSRGARNRHLVRVFRLTPTCPCTPWNPPAKAYRS